MNIKRCIFHIPNYVNPKGLSGSQVRPLKMLQAFKDSGYEVHAVMGNGYQRKKSIRKIKKNIKSGVKYDFMYSESNTMPTLLTGWKRIPLNPLLDFSFFNFCKKHGIKIGLFYRDIHWKFGNQENIRFVKKYVFLPMYNYDLVQYKKYVDVLYLPSMKMNEYVNILDNTLPLPPGCDFSESFTKRKIDIKTNENLELLYVGGIQGNYNLTKLLQAIKDLPFISLTICCRGPEWINVQNDYENLLTNRITIVHTSGKDLDEYYKKADICLIFFEGSGYWKIASPIKMFEYLAHVTPIVACNGSVAGDFVQENNIGWVIEHNIEELQKLLTDLHKDKTLIAKKQRILKEVAEKNTWKARAQTVIKDLGKEG